MAVTMHMDQCTWGWCALLLVCVREARREGEAEGLTEGGHELEGGAGVRRWGRSQRVSIRHGRMPGFGTDT